MTTTRPRAPAADLAAGITAALLLAACGTSPPPGATPLPPAVPTLPGAVERDGAEANPPPDLEQVPDAQPRVEPLRPGGPNRPYQIGGTLYTPVVEDRP